MILTVDPLPQITATPDSVSVCGTPVDVTFSSSLASTTYTWSGSNGTSGTGNISTFINNTTTHDSIVIYTIVGKAPGGCTDTIRVPAVSHPVPILTASGFTKQMCSGTYYTGTVVSNTPGTTITWSSTLGPNGTGGNINQLFNNAGTIPDTVIVSFTGTTSGGCVSNVLKDTVIVYPLPHANAGPNQVMVSCSADSIQLGGSPTASGGTPGYTYLWSPPHLGGINDTLANPYIKQVGANATYTVTVTDSKGCTASSSMNLTVQPPTLAVSISASGPTTWCEGTSGTVDLTADISGGTPLYSFAWTPTTALTDSNGQVATVNPSSAGSYPYTVVVTDHNGCQASATRTIIVKPEPHPVITGLDSDYCANVGSVPLTASVPGGTWSGSGVVGSTFRPSFFGPGVYTVIYTVTTGGCTNDTFQKVTVDSLPVVTISGNSGSYCSSGPSATFTGSPAGGTWSGLGINPATGVFNPSAITITNGIWFLCVITTTQGCTASDTVFVHVNQSPYAASDRDTLCGVTSSLINVLANDTDPEHDTEVVSIVTAPHHGTASLDSNEILYNVAYGYFGYDTLTYKICNSQCLHDCDTAKVYLSICPRNLPPTADTIVYTQLVTIPEGVNVSLATSDPNGDPLTISIVGDSTDGGNVTVVKNGNGSYTITGDSLGTFVITYQVCDTDQYPIHVLCDTSVIVAHIVPPGPDTLDQPPVANNDFATTSGTTPADVNVRGNDYSNPTSDGLTKPTLISSTTTTDGHWTVNSVGDVVFTPDAGLAPGIYYDTVYYQNNDSDPDGNPLTIPTIVIPPSDGTIVSVGDNGTIIYTPRPGTHSINGQPVDSFEYYICDSLAAHLPRPLCDSAEVYIYVVPKNLPPTADTIVYTQMDSIPEGINVSLSTSAPNGAPVTISIINNPDPGVIHITNTSPGAYVITGDSLGTFVITYEVCDTGQYPPLQILCDTSVIIAHIIPPADTQSNASDGLTTPTLLSSSGTSVSSDTTTDGTWTVNSNGNVVFTPNIGLTPGIYYDTVHYRIASNITSVIVWQHIRSIRLCDSAEVYVYVAPANLPPTADTIVYTQMDSLPEGITILCDTSVIIAHIVPPGPDTLDQPPVANNDFATTSGTTPAVVNVRGNDFSNPTSDGLTTPTLLSSGGTSVSSDTTADGTWTVNSNGNVVFTPNAGLAPGIYYDTVHYQPVDSFKYYICDSLAAHPVHPLCDSAEVYIYVVPANLPPTADTIRYTQFDSIPQDVNVSLATSTPNGASGTITIINNPDPGVIIIDSTSPGAYTIIGNDTGTYVITYEICDTGQYPPMQILCDTSVIIAHIITKTPNTLTPQPPTANNDFATTSGTTPAVVNVRGNDYSNPPSDGLTTPRLITSTTTPDGTWSVNSNGNVVFTPNAGLAPGIYYDTVYYQVCDSVNPTLCATAYVVVTTNEIDTPIYNRPPVAVDDHETVPENTTSSFNVKNNDSDPDGNPLTIPTIIDSSKNGEIVSVGDNGTIIYKPNPDVHSINGQPVDSFKYYICDSLAAHPVHPLCDSAEVYIYVTPSNLPPTADTIVYTQMDSVPEGINVSLSTSAPNGVPVTISIINNPDPGVLHITNTSPGAYTITGDSIGTFVITYEVCDTGQYPPFQILCDTSVIIAHIIPPADTVHQPPVANNDFATTSGTTPAVVNVRGNDFSNPTSDGLTTPVLISSTTTAHGTWSVNGNGNVVFTPDSGLAPGIYYDTVHYQVCDPVDSLCATAYVVVTTDEVDTPIANRHR
ncbi:unnamed protein product [Sphagnum balticum]